MIESSDSLRNPLGTAASDLNKKNPDASGDLPKAFTLTSALARDVVNHYINNILPDGFKAQVVWHSKIAAIRYQKAIREALTERVRAFAWLGQPWRGIFLRSGCQQF